jgi:hypothetical protein
MGTAIFSGVDMSTNKRLAEFFVHFSSITTLFVKLTIWNFTTKTASSNDFQLPIKKSMKNGIV